MAGAKEFFNNDALAIEIFLPLHVLPRARAFASQVRYSHLGIYSDQLSPT